MLLRRMGQTGSSLTSIKDIEELFLSSSDYKCEKKVDLKVYSGTGIIYSYNVIVLSREILNLLTKDKYCIG